MAIITCTNPFRAFVIGASLERGDWVGWHWLSSTWWILRGAGKMHMSKSASETLLNKANLATHWSEARQGKLRGKHKHPPNTGVTRPSAAEPARHGVWPSNMINDAKVVQCLGYQSYKTCDRYTPMNTKQILKFSVAVLGFSEVFQSFVEGKKNGRCNWQKQKQWTECLNDND